jgi:hypothetical protein
VHTVTATDGDGVTGTSGNITTQVGAAAKLGFVQQPSNAAAGASITPAVTVAIQDANGNVVTTATDNVTLAIGTNPSSGTLSGTATVAAVNGVATFSDLSINKVGTGYTLGASSGSLTTATSTGFDITPGAAAKLAFTVQPSNVVASATIAPAVQVSILDTFDNLVTSATDNVTVAIGNNPSSGTLSGTTTVAAVNGVATFSNLSINLVGTGYTLAASSGSLTGATSSAFNVTHGPLHHFLVKAAGGGDIGAQLAGTPFNVQVTAQDEYNNTVTNFTGTVGFTSTPSGGITAGGTSGAFTAGVLTSHAITFGTPGSFTLTATNTAAGAQTGTSNSFQVQAPPRAVNDGPTSNSAPGDAFHTAFNTALTAPSGNTPTLLANDTLGFPLATVSHFGGGSLPGDASTTTVGSTATGANGSVTVNADGSFTFTPTTGFTGLFTFSYRLTNVRGFSDAQVTIAVGARPAATNDTYSPQLVGNVPVNTATSTQFRVTTNDSGDGKVLAITGQTNGTATLNADSTFTFRPAAGFRNGQATFTYTVTNGFGTSPAATVTMTVADAAIWFVNAGAGSNGDGRYDSPKNCLVGTACFSDVPNDAANDRIFLYTGSYTGGLTLLSGQRLIGQRATASLSSVAGVTWPADAGAEPSMSSASALDVTAAAGGTAVTLSSGNLLRGFNLGTVGATGTALAGTGFGTLAISEVGISTNGRALNLSTGTLNGSLTGVTSTGGANNIALSGVGTTGTFSFGSGALSGATGDALAVTGASTGTFTYGGTIAGGAGAAVNIGGGTSTLTLSGNVTQGNNAALLNVTGAHTGTLTMTGQLSATNGTGLQFNDADGTYNLDGVQASSALNGGDAGIDILNGSGGTFTFGSNLAISNPSGTAVYANASSPTLAVKGPVTQGAARRGIYLENNTGGTSTFSGLLTLNTTTQNAFEATHTSLTGTVVAPNTANVLSTTTGTALRVNNVNIGAGGLVFRSVSADGAPNGIVLNNTGAVAGLTVTGTGSTANSGGTIQNTTGHAISLTNARDVQLALMSIQPNASGVVAGNLSGTNKLERSTVDYLNTAPAGAYAFRVANNSTNATITLDGTTFQNKLDGTTSVSISAMGSSQITFNAIDSNTGDAFENKYTNLFGSGIVVGVGDDNGSTAVVTANVSNGKFLSAPTNGLNNLEMTVQQNATLVPNITNNQFDKVGLPLAVVGVINLNTTQAGRIGSNGSAGLISNNQVTNITSLNTTFAYDPAGPNGYVGLRVAIDNNVAGVNHKVQILGNTFTNLARRGMYISARGMANDVNVKIDGNTIGTLAAPVGKNNIRGVEIETQSQAALKIDVTNNPSIVNSGSSGSNSALHFRSGVDNNTTATIQATVTGNVIRNTNVANTAGRFRAQTLGVAAGLTSPAGNMCLDLRGNTLEDGSKLFELIHESGGTFTRNVAGNTGTVTETGTFASAASCTRPAL